MDGIEYYLAGAYIGINCREYIFVKNTKISFGGCIYILATMFTGFRIWNFVTKLLFIFAVWFALDCIPQLEERKFPWWMSITFFTYVAHDAILEAFEKVIMRVFGLIPLFALLDYIFTPLIIEMVLIGVAYVLKKFLPMVWKLLTGSR
jgi:hypothetical protein